MVRQRTMQKMIPPTFAKQGTPWLYWQDRYGGGEGYHWFWKNRVKVCVLVYCRRWGYFLRCAAAKTWPVHYNWASLVTSCASGSCAFQPSSGETPLGLVGPGLPGTGDTLQMQEERGARKPGGWLACSSELAINSAQMVTSFWESASGAKSLA